MATLIREFRNVVRMNNGDTFTVPNGLSKFLVAISGGGGGGSGSALTPTLAGGNGGPSALQLLGVDVVRDLGGAGGAGVPNPGDSGLPGASSAQGYDGLIAGPTAAFHRGKGFLGLGISGGDGGAAGTSGFPTGIQGAGKHGQAGQGGYNPGSGGRGQVGTTGGTTLFIPGFGGAGGGAFPKLVEVQCIPGQVYSAIVGSGGNGSNGAVSGGFDVGGGGGGGGAGGFVWILY